MKNRWLVLGAIAVAVAGGVILMRHLRSGRTLYPAFVQAFGEQKNFGAFPPEIPEYEFEESDFFS